MSLHDRWHSRSPERMSDEVWRATLTRVRGEFEEMPCMRVTPEQASTLLGLERPLSIWVLEHLTQEGFLSRTEQGEYLRRNGAP